MSNRAKCDVCGRMMAKNGVCTGDHRSPETRFREKVDASGGEGSCWPWTAGHDRKGYGVFSHGHDRPWVQAHRFAWELANGKDPAGKVIRHRCDNPPCCNPAHLIDGTTQDNADDCVARDRQIKGETINTAKLTPAKVIEIRARWKAGATQIALGAEFGVYSSTIAAIVHGKSWKHVALSAAI